MVMRGAAVGGGRRRRVAAAAAHGVLCRTVRVRQVDAVRPWVEEDRNTRVGLQLQQGSSTGTAAAGRGRTLPVSLTAAVGILHRDCSCRPGLTGPEVPVLGLMKRPADL